MLKFLLCFLISFSHFLLMLVMRYFFVIPLISGVVASKYRGNKTVNIKYSAHDTFLEMHSRKKNYINFSFFFCLFFSSYVNADMYLLSVCVSSKYVFPKLSSSEPVIIQKYYRKVAIIRSYAFTHSLKLDLHLVRPNIRHENNGRVKRAWRKFNPRCQTLIDWRSFLWRSIVRNCYSHLNVLFSI